MLEHLRRISSQTLIYGLGDAVTRVATLFLLPVYTRFLTPDDYGKFAITTLFATVVALILDFGQRTAFFRFYFDTDDQDERRRLTGTVLLFLLIAAAVILLPLVGFFDRIAPPLVSDLTLVPLIKITLIGTFFEVGSAVPFAVFRAKQYAAKYAVRLWMGLKGLLQATCPAGCHDAIVVGEADDVAFRQVERLVASFR